MIAISNSKVSAPRLAGAVARTRLFEQIDAIRERGRRLIWLAGAPVSGKTTLAAGYLAHCGASGLWLRVYAADADPADLLAHCVAAAERAGLADASKLPPLRADLHGGWLLLVRLTSALVGVVIGSSFVDGHIGAPRTQP